MFEQLPQACAVARRATEARVHIKLREFLHRGGKLRRIHRGSEFERRLRFAARHAAPRENPQQFSIQARSKLRVRADGLGRAQAKKQAKALNHFDRHIEAQSYEPQHECQRKR